MPVGFTEMLSVPLPLQLMDMAATLMPADGPDQHLLGLTLVFIQPGMGYVWMPGIAT